MSRTRTGNEPPPSVVPTARKKPDATVAAVAAARACVRLRGRVDRVNAALARLLQQRAALVIAIGKMKKRAGLPAIDPARERSMQLRFSAARGGYSPAALRRILRAVLRESHPLVRRVS